MREHYNMVSVTLLLNVLLSYPICPSPVLQLVYTKYVVLVNIGVVFFFVNPNTILDA